MKEILFCINACWKKWTQCTKGKAQTIFYLKKKDDINYGEKYLYILIICLDSKV